jgi:uncharacterized protein (DUF2141 family)
VIQVIQSLERADEPNRKKPRGNLSMKAIHDKLWIYSLLLIGAAASLVSAPVSAVQSSITVTVSGIRSQEGSIMVCLWSQQDEEFPVCSATASMQYATAEPASSGVTVTFQNIPDGEYAISAFHDENGNVRLDRGFMGRPEEGIALSNMNMERRERPSFDRAKFTLNGTETISLSLRYF